MIQVNQIRGLNKKARKFLLEHCVSKRGVEVIASNFTGYINGITFENVDLIREGGKWRVFGYSLQIESLGGSVEYFSLTKNTIL